MEFEILMQSLWILFKSGKDVHNSACFLMSKQYFRFPDVASATVAYWFERFNSNLSFFNDCLGIISFISLNLRLEFLSALKNVYPSWTIEHYMDALKLSRQTMEWYIRTLNRIQSNNYH